MGMYPRATWDKSADLPKIEDFVLVRHQYWVVLYTVHGGSQVKYICFRNGIRKIFTIDEMEALIKNNV